MRYAILSDIHANIAALQAVLAAAEAQRAERLLCLGDLVGYYADPNECVALVRARGVQSIAGNHDRAAVGSKRTDDFGEAARRAMDWTRRQLTAEHQRYLAELPLTAVIEGSHPRLLLVHGGLHPQPNDDLHLSTEARVRRSCERLADGAYGARLCFFGHTHRGAAYRYQRGELTTLAADRVALDGACFLINPGSVGQPRDGDPRASFVIYDSDEQMIQYHRVPYDSDACLDRARAAGLLSEAKRGLLRRSAAWLRDQLKDQLRARWPG